MKYTNKFVEFLNGANTIKISGERDFTMLRTAMKKVGLDCFSNYEGFGNYYDLLSIARINNCLINYSTILVEYQPYKGLTFGYRTYEESENWYGKKPWTMKEVHDDMK